MIRLRLAARAILLLAAFLASCSDDDPLGTDSPCDDPNTTCLHLTLKPSDMTYETRHHVSPVDETYHALIWDMEGKVLSNYGPGQLIIVNLTFDPPLTVRYDHSSHRAGMRAGGVTCFDRATSSTGTASSTGWPISYNSVFFYGDCLTGASAVSSVVYFKPLVAGHKMVRLSFAFTVPDTYANGDGQGTPVLPGDLVVEHVILSGWTTGDTTANGPLAWPGEYTPITVLGEYSR